MLCKNIVSDISLFIFLIVLIVLSSFGIVYNNKFSCDNGVLINVIQGPPPCMEKCRKLAGISTNYNGMENFNGSNPKFNNCMNDNDCGACVNSDISRIINIVLIIIISLTGIFMFYKFFCIFV